MEKHVFIPTRGRYGGQISKLCKIWEDKDFNVHVVVEPLEAMLYADIVSRNATVHALPSSDLGIAFSRNYCVELAEFYGLKSIILADDDIKPSTRRHDGMAEILEACEHDKILGITARYSYHDLCLGPDIKEMDDIILLSTGTFRLVGLNVQNVIKLGNYDYTLEYAEDCDLFLRGLRAGFPWMVHLGSFANSIGTRYEPGGMLDFAGGHAGLDARKARWHDDIHMKWPKVTNEHTNKCRGKQNCISVQWKRAYDLYLPGWRKWSELDGGDLQEYIDA